MALPGSIRLETVNGQLRVRALDGADKELLSLIGGDPLGMIREAVSVLDPELGMNIGADPNTIVRRLIGKRDG